MKRLLLAAVVILGAVSLWAQSDPSVGTWKLNTAKSKYDPGPGPRSNTIVITMVGSALKVSAKGTDAEGKPTSLEYTANYDGKEVPVRGAPAYDTTAMKRIDANTVEGVRKKGGKVIQTARRTVSSDGKTLMVTTTGVDERGRKINNVAVYEKQSTT